jgi:hypothetical protein
MGTYGTTHVKKDNKIITFSDSYDGYIGGGMGQANINCIKFLSTPILKNLFDKFTASSKVPVEQAQTYQEEQNDDQERGSVNQRTIEDTIYRVEQDTKDPEAAQWMNDVLSDSIRTSVCGFAPLLYLNINNHYGRDYDYCDYLVDLDNEVFSFHSGVKIPFEKIRKASTNQLDALCNELIELLPKELQEEAKGFFYAHYTDENAEKANKIVDAYLTIDESTVEAYYKTKEEERQKWLAEHETRKAETDKIFANDSDDYGAYSIRTGNIGVHTLRTILSLMYKVNKAIPESEFLTTHTEWGVSEDYTEAGIRIFSPMSNDKQMHAIYDNFVFLLEQQFKLRLNIFSSTGKWSFDVQPQEHDEENQDKEEFMPLMFNEVVPGPQKSVFSLEEIRKFEGQENIFGSLHPYLTIHGKYDEVRELVLNPEQKVTAPIIWVYVALLNQDAAVFDRVYPLAQEIFKELDEKNTKGVCGGYLQSLAEGLTINRIVPQYAQSLGKVVEEDNSQGFIKHLQSTTFFQDVAPYMNSAEKAQYGIKSDDSDEPQGKKAKIKVK